LIQALVAGFEIGSSYESSAIASRLVGDGLTFKVQLVFGYAGPSMTPATLRIPMIPQVTHMQFLGAFGKSGKSVDTHCSLTGPGPVFSFDEIASRVTDAKVLGTEVIDRHPCDVVEVQYEDATRNPNHEPTRYWIDQSTRIVWKMQFSERDVLSKTDEPVRWTVVWDSWTVNQPPPSWLLGAGKTLLAAKEKTTLAGKHAPKVSGRTINGSPFELSKLKGSVVVLDFWATWCGPCAEEMAALERLKASLSGKAVEIWSVTEDGPANVRRWLAERKRTLPTALIPRNTAFRSYRVDSLPQIAIIDQNGLVAHQWVGLKKEGDLRKEIETLLAR
jgi:peroxiredoxin